MSVNEVVEGEFQATHSLFFLSLEDKKIQIENVWPPQSEIAYLKNSLKSKE